MSDLQEEIVECDASDQPITPYNYQISLFEFAKSSNLVAAIGTGCGKTFLAVMIIKHFLHETTAKKFADGAKRTFFLACNVPLAHQQQNYLNKHIPANVGIYVGEMGVDSMTDEQWFNEFSKNEVIVMTPAILDSLLTHDVIEMSRINLLVFDECHHTSGNHPYNKIMDIYHRLKNQCQLRPRTDLPKILGLTASVTAKKSSLSQFQSSTQKLADRLDSVIEYGIVDSKRNCSVALISYELDSLPFARTIGDYVEAIQTKIDELQKHAESRRIAEETNIIDKAHEHLGDKVGTILKVDHDLISSIRMYGQLRNILRDDGSFSAGKNLSRHLRSVVNSVEEFGIMAGLSLINYLLTKKTEQNSQSEIQKLFWDGIASIKNYILELKPNVNDIFEGHETTIKFRSLADFLNAQHSANSKLHVIVFVETRAGAYALTKLLNFLAATKDEYNWMKAEQVVGQDSSIWTEYRSFKQQLEVIKRFKSLKINVLVATSVIEEGIDIPSCNLIIHTYPTKNFVSFQQSKGRARHENSIYAIMAASGLQTDSFTATLEQFIEIESFMVDQAIEQSNKVDRTISSAAGEDEIVISPCEMTDESMTEEDNIEILRKVPSRRKDDGDVHVTIGAKQVHPINLIRIIYRYSTSISKSRADSHPFFMIRKTAKEDDPNKVEFSCLIFLPHNASIKGWITVGPKCRSKRVAKFTASAELCKTLYELGELNEKLVPLSFLLKQQEKAARRAVHERAKIQYKYVRAPLWKHLVPGEINPAKETDGIRHWMYLIYVKTNLLHVALVINEPFDQVDFVIQERTGAYVTPIRLKLHRTLGSIDESGADPQKLAAFTDHIIGIFPKIAKKSKISWKNGTLKNFAAMFIPLKPDSAEVDNHLLDHFRISSEGEKDNEMKLWTISKDSASKPRVNSLVFRNYGISFLRSHLMVVKYISDKTSTSVMDTNEQGHPVSFQNYMEKTYQLELAETKENLLRCASIRQTLKYAKKVRLWPMSVQDHANKSRHEIFLVPSLVHTLPTTMTHVYHCSIIIRSLWEMIRYRRSMALNQIVLEFVRKGVQCEDDVKMTVDRVQHWPAPPINNRISISWETSVIGSGDRDAFGSINPFDDVTLDKMCGKLFDSETKTINFPESLVSGLNIATTHNSCASDGNLERVEFLGDVILKTITTLFLFNTSSKEKSSESILSSNRQLLISNQFLFEVAEKLEISKFVASKQFTIFHYDNLKDLLIVDEKAEPESEEMNYKRISDVIEAILGVVFMATGSFDLTTRFLSGLIGKSLTPNRSMAIKIDRLAETESEAFIVQKENAIEQILWQTKCLERLENLIGYKFKDRRLLIEATSHSSDVNNTLTLCYERLEFLGDSIIDFLVAWHIIRKCPSFDPGKLSKLKGILVCNKMLATICLLNKLQVFLSYGSPIMLTAIDEFHNQLVELMDPNLEKSCFPYEKLLKEDIREPKYIADMMEAIAGAIFMDSGYSFLAVWESFYPFFKDPINFYTEMIEKEMAEDRNSKLEGRWKSRQNENVQRKRKHKPIMQEDSSATKKSKR